MQNPRGDASLIVGCGDLGLRVARQLRQRGSTVQGVVRTDGSVASLAAEGIPARALDLDSEPLSVADADLVYWFAPPPAQGQTDPRLRRTLDAMLARPVRRLVYVSTSGVYGDCAGRWIDEDEPLKPRTDRARRRLDAERALAGFALATGCQTVILRVPGIYGPGRLPLERLRSAAPVIHEPESPWSNRIHVEDLAQAALAAMARGRAGAAYNVSDGNPSSMSDYFLRCARLLGLPEPPRITLQEARSRLTPAMRSFLDESKRLLITRMREELGVRLRFPDLDAGLRACLA